jgi:nucleoside-diphosphate-sugar epimerase
MKKALVCGAGGFIGSHLVKRLKAEGFWVRGVDLKYPRFSPTPADDFIVGDLRDMSVCREAVDRRFDEVYQLAADMGGAGYIFTGENDAQVMHNSAQINLNMLEACRRRNCFRIFYSSSACIYPEYRQMDVDNVGLMESDAYPAAPDSEYGWEKLFSERLYMTYARNHGFEVRIARYHNIFGPEGSWNDGPVNIGSDEMVSINKLAEMVAKIAKKSIGLRHIPGPLGVRGRNSNNKLIAERLGWQPSAPLNSGLAKTYAWIEQQVQYSQTQNARIKEVA